MTNGNAERFQRLQTAITELALLNYKAGLMDGCEPNVVTLSRSDRDVLTDALEHLWLTKPARRAAVERLTAKVDGANHPAADAARERTIEQATLVGRLIAELRQVVA